MQAIRHGDVTLKVYEVNLGNRTIFSVAHKQDGRRQLKQFGDLAAALTWASTRAKEIDRGNRPSVMLSPDEGASYRRAKVLGDVTGFIGNVTQGDISMWLAKLGLAPRSHDNFRQAIVLLFRFAQKRGHLPEGKTAAEKTELMGEAGEGDTPARRIIVKWLPSSTRSLRSMASRLAMSGVCRRRSQ